MDRVKYSLSSDEVTKLRNAGNGRVRLVLYNDGIACLPPLMRAVSKDHPQSQEEFVEFLKTSKQEALDWTQNVLKRQ